MDITSSLSRCSGRTVIFIRANIECKIRVQSGPPVRRANHSSCPSAKEFKAQLTSSLYLPLSQDLQVVLGKRLVFYFYSKQDQY